MEILDTASLADFTSTLQEILTANVVIIIGVVALAVGITFVVRWFQTGAYTVIFWAEDKDGKGMHRRFR